MDVGEDVEEEKSMEVGGRLEGEWHSRQGEYEGIAIGEFARNEEEWEGRERRRKENKMGRRELGEMGTQATWLRRKCMSKHRN